VPGIDITVTGDKENARRIMRCGERGMNMRPIFEVLSDDWEDIMDEHFESEGARSGRRWVALSESRIKQKATQDLDPRILHATLALRNSLTRRNASGSVRRITNSSLLRGTSIEYAEHHHYGTVRVPQRRVFVFTNRDRSAWQDVLEEYVINGRVRAPMRW
jgi:phage gpG-like protein